jgi:hypothetical protein
MIGRAGGEFSPKRRSMLLPKLRDPGDRRFLKKTALGLSFRIEYKTSLAPQPKAPRGFLLRGFRACSSTVTLTLLARLLAVTFASAEGIKSTVQVSTLIVETQLDNPIKLSQLRPGSIVQGRTTRDVYSGERQLFLAGSRVRLTVGKLERRRRGHNDHWPWVIQVFARGHENYPSFQSAEISLPDGASVTVRVSLLSAHRLTQVSAPVKSAASFRAKSPLFPKGKKKSGQEMAASGPTWILEADRPTGANLTSTDSATNSPNQPSAPSSGALTGGPTRA